MRIARMLADVVKDISAPLKTKRISFSVLRNFELSFRVVKTNARQNGKMSKYSQNKTTGNENNKSAIQNPGRINWPKLSLRRRQKVL